MVSGLWHLKRVAQGVSGPNVDVLFRWERSTESESQQEDRQERRWHGDRDVDMAARE